MSESPSAPPANLIGYAIGFGAAFTALAGTVTHFAFPELSDWIALGGSFLVGAAIGAAVGRARHVELRD